MGKFSDGCPDSGHTNGRDCDTQKHWTRSESGADAWDEPGSSSGRSSSCFPFNTPISTPSGVQKIGDLQVGDIVMSYQKGFLVPRPVTRKRVRGLAQVTQVKFSSGGTLCATKHHTFLTETGWLKLENIKCGDKIIRAKGAPDAVTALVVQGIEPVFNIYTADEHTFIADGVVAHNFSEFRALRTFLHRIFLDPVAELLRIEFS